MVDAGARIGIAAADRVPPIDPIERGKRRAREIIDQKTMRRHEEDTMRRARRVAIAAHD